MPLSRRRVFDRCIRRAGLIADESSRITASGIAAVLAVKVVSTVYAVTAWREERRDREAEAAVEAEADRTLDAEVARRIAAAQQVPSKKLQ